MNKQSRKKLIYVQQEIYLFKFIFGGASRNKIRQKTIAQKYCCKIPFNCVTMSITQTNKTTTVLSSLPTTQCKNWREDMWPSLVSVHQWAWSCDIKAIKYILQTAKLTPDQICVSAQLSSTSCIKFVIKTTRNKKQSVSLVSHAHSLYPGNK